MNILQGSSFSLPAFPCGLSENKNCFGEGIAGNLSLVENKEWSLHGKQGMFPHGKQGMLPCVHPIRRTPPAGNANDPRISRDLNLCSLKSGSSWECCSGFAGNAALPDPGEAPFPHPCGTPAAPGVLIHPPPFGKAILRNSTGRNLGITSPYSLGKVSSKREQPEPRSKEGKHGNSLDSHLRLGPARNSCRFLPREGVTWKSKAPGIAVRADRSVRLWLQGADQRKRP